MDDIRLISFDEMVAITGRSKGSIYNDMRAGRFPLPVKMNGRAVKWLSTEVQAWIESLPRAEYPPPSDQ